MITLDSEKCVACNSCVRVCPIHEANIAYMGENKNIIVSINNDRCINCGECIKACKHDARDFVDDTEKFFNDLRNKEDIILLIAPAIRVAFDGYWDKVLNWFRQKGIRYIMDGALGADICTWAHIELIKQEKITNVISQPCAATTSYILKYKPKLIPHLSPVHSPLLCLAIYAKNYLKLQGKIVAITPCISKKDEFQQTGIVEYNVTFEKLKNYFKKNNITFSTNNNSKFEFDHLQGLMGSIYPIPGGLGSNIHAHTNVSIINSEGISNVYKNLSLYEGEEVGNLPAIFDILSCENGCASGPAMGKECSIYKINKIMTSNEQYNINKRKKQTKSKQDNQFKQFTRKFKLLDFLREYKSEYIKDYMPSNQELEQVYNSLYKFNEASRKFDCKACGFDTCKEMACAIFNDRNLVENCLQSTKSAIEGETVKITNMNMQIVNLTKQLSEVFNILSQNIGAVKSNVSDIDVFNEKNETDIKELLYNIENLRQSSNKIVNAMSDIDNSINSYNSMTDNVIKIATQINMLSINASIEAVRAGEAGKGFMVVAHQVGVLATNSKKAVAEAENCNNKVELAIDNINIIIESIDLMVFKILDMVNSILKNIQLTSDRGKSINSSMYDVTVVSKEVEELIIKTQEN